MIPLSSSELELPRDGWIGLMYMVTTPRLLQSPIASYSAFTVDLFSVEMQQDWTEHSVIGPVGRKKATAQSSKRAAKSRRPASTLKRIKQLDEKHS
jgi:hypothetical protein